MRTSTYFAPFFVAALSAASASFFFSDAGTAAVWPIALKERAHGGTRRRPVVRPVYLMNLRRFIEE
jgi:hypothetical protein